MPNTILLVEDEEEIRKTIAAELDDAGYSVVQAANGLEALDLLQTETPDLILSDISMPGLDGIGLLQTIRKQCPRQADTPFLFLTAYSDRDRQITARRYGADEFLNKPIDIEVLLAVVENQIRKRQASKEQHNDDLIKLFRKLHLAPDRTSFAFGRKAKAGTPEHSLSENGKPSDGHSIGGWITLIGLNDVKEKLGPRWSQVASTVRHLAENKIAQNLSEEDTYASIGGDTFQLCIHSKSEAESSATVRRIKQQILDGLGALKAGDGGLSGASESDLAILRQVRTEFYPMAPADEADDAHGDVMDVVSARIERAAKAFAQNSSQMLAQIAQDSDVRLVPILDRNLAATRLAYCALDPAGTSTELQMRSAFGHDGQTMLELDMAKLGLAIQSAMTGASRQFASFVVSVDVNSIRTPKSRQRYLSLFGKTPHATRSQFIFLVDNGLGQVHASLLTDVIRSLKPFSITCWLRATTPELFDSSINEAVAPVVAMNYFDLENTIRTSSEKLRTFRKSIAARRSLLMIDGIADTRQHNNAKNLAPNYYCFDGSPDPVASAA